MNQSTPEEPRYTVIVVPESGPRTTKLVVGAPHVRALNQLARLDGVQLRRAAWICGSLAFVLLGTAAGMAWRYFQVVGRATENTQLREENLELKAKLAALNERVTAINSNLHLVKSFTQNLQNIMQLRDDERGLALAVGDVEHPDRREEADPQRLENDIDHATADVESQVGSLRALSAYFSEQQALLSSAPSIWPVRGWVTSDFGVRFDPYTGERKIHEGIDIANAIGSPVVAPADGTVVYASPESGYGNVLVLDHGNGLKTRYGHLQRIDVKVGERIRRGDVVAALGNTGRSTGPHVHYEVRVNGVPENPRRFILESSDPGEARGVAISARDAHGVGGGN